MLEVNHLRYSSNGRIIVDDLTLSIGKQEIHAIIGANGTGKTTLAYLVMGIYSPFAGNIFFEGEDITACSISERAQKGITLAWQDPARFEGLKVEEYLKLSSKNGSRSIEDFLSMVGLLPSHFLNRTVDEDLSGGERRRVELAAVLAMQPKLAILDEVDSGIDVASLPYIMEGVSAMKSQGSSVLLITHSKDAPDIANKASLLCAGRVLQTGSPEEMSQWFGDRCVICNHVNMPEEGSE